MVTPGGRFTLTLGCGLRLTRVAVRDLNGILPRAHAKCSDAGVPNIGTDRIFIAGVEATGDAELKSAIDSGFLVLVDPMGLVQQVPSLVVEEPITRVTDLCLEPVDDVPLDATSPLVDFLA